jgi:hypothetical protein
MRAWGGSSAAQCPRATQEVAAGKQSIRDRSAEGRLIERARMQSFRGDWRDFACKVSNRNDDLTTDEVSSEVLACVPPLRSWGSLRGPEEAAQLQ